MKILVLAELNFKKPYGSHTRPFYLSENLNALGNEIWALCFEGSPIYRWTRTCKSLRFPRPFSYLLFLSELIATIRKFRPNIIYVHNNMFAIVAYIARYLGGIKIPIVLDKHGSWTLEQTTSRFYSMLKMLEYVAVKSSDWVIAASDDLADSLISIYNLSSNKVSVVNNGVSSQLLTCRQSIPAIYSEIVNKKIIILSAPRNFTANEYAIRFMYDVMNIIGKKDRHIVLLITGSGKKINPVPLNVIYTGFVDNLADYLSFSDLAVSPYPRNATCGGARNKVLEYFACQTLVVSTKEGMRGIQGAYPNKHFVLADDDPDIFAEKVLFALSHKDGLQYIVLNAKQLVKNDYIWEKLALKVQSVLQSAVHQKL